MRSFGAAINLQRWTICSRASTGGKQVFLSLCWCWPGPAAGSSEKFYETVWGDWRRRGAIPCRSSSWRPASLSCAGGWFSWRLALLWRWSSSPPSLSVMSATSSRRASLSSSPMSAVGPSGSLSITGLSKPRIRKPCGHAPLWLRSWPRLASFFSTPSPSSSPCKTLAMM